MAPAQRHETLDNAAGPLTVLFQAEPAPPAPKPADRTDPAVVFDAAYFLCSTFETQAIFDRFASLRTPAGERLLSPADFMRACVPTSNYALFESPPPAPGRAAPANRGVAAFLASWRLLPSGRSGLTVHEFRLLRVFLALPPQGVAAAFSIFDRDGSGDIDEAEFVAAVRSLARAAHVSAAAFDASVKALRDPKTSLLLAVLLKGGGLTLATFERFVTELHAAVRAEEFRYYDPGNTGTVSLRAFGHAALAGGARRSAGFAAGGSNRELLARLDSLGTGVLDSSPGVPGGRVTFAEFSTLHEARAAREAMDLMMKLHGKGLGALFRDVHLGMPADKAGVTRPMFARYVRAALSGDARRPHTPFTPGQLDVLFRVFSADPAAESLSAAEIEQLLERRVCQAVPAGTFASVTECMLACLKQEA